MKESKSVILGAVFIAIAAIMWGIDGIALTPRLYNLNIIFVVFILHFLPFAVMNLFFYKSYSKLKKLDKVELMSLAFVAIFGGVIGTLAIVKALFIVNFKSLSIVVLLQKLQPIFAIFLALIFLKEKLRKGYLFWAVIALVAGYFLTFGISLPSFESSDNNFVASNYALLAAFSFGASTVFGKKVMGSLNFSSATFFRYGIASVVMLLVVVATGNFWEISNVTKHNWFYIILISATTGSGSMMLYYYGLKRVKALIATIMELFYPISAVFFDYLINGNILSPVQIFAALIMVYSIINLNTDNVRAIARIRVKMRKARRSKKS